MLEAGCVCHWGRSCVCLGPGALAPSGRLVLVECSCGRDLFVDDWQLMGALGMLDVASRSAGIALRQRCWVFRALGVPREFVGLWGALGAGSGLQVSGPSSSVAPYFCRVLVVGWFAGIAAGLGPQRGPWVSCKSSVDFHAIRQAGRGMSSWGGSSGVAKSRGCGCGPRSVGFIGVHFDTSAAQLKEG